MQVRWRRVVRRGTLLALVPVVLVSAANAVVIARTHGLASSEVADLPHAQVAIVPGALVRADGSMSGALRARVDGALELYRAGVVDAILVSGDNGRADYDETDTMRDAVLAGGVPPAVVFTDYAGFDTWHTMRRARDVFEVDSAIVVTQATFAARSLDLGHAAGLRVHALTVEGLTGGKARRSGARELLARVKGLGQATFHTDVTGGPRLPITGDGRTSWGPVAPDPAVGWSGRPPS